MADAYKGLTVKLGADTSSLSSALRKARSEVSGLTTNLKLVEKALKLDPGNVNLLAQQQSAYQKEMQSTKKQLDLLKQAEAELSKLDSFTPEQEAQWVRLQSDIVITQQKLEGYEAALKDSIAQQKLSKSSLANLGDTLQSAGDKLESVSTKMQNIGSTLTRTVTAGVATVGAATVTAATDIDTSLTNVKKTVDGTDEQYQQLKESAIEFSQTNAVSASQILDIQALGAQLGFAIEELDEFSQVVSGLDIATDMDADTAATELAQFANITKMAHDEIGNYGSAIVGLGNSFATTESDISSMAMRLAASGTQVGMSQADILGLATALSSMGVEAEAGGTAISTIMAQIDKDIATNSDAIQTWASTAGMSAQDFADAWKADPVEALSALLANMEKTTAEGGNMSVMLEELGIDSVRQTDIMKRLAGNSELVGDAVAKANEEWEANTALSDEVDNRNGSLASQFEIVKNRVVAVADNIGGPLADALLDALDAAEPLFEAIADGAEAFAEMDESDQQLVLGLVGIAAAAGPVLSVTGKLVSVMGKVDKATGNAVKSVATHAAETKAAAEASKLMASNSKTAGAAVETTGKKAKVAAASTKVLNGAMSALKAAIPMVALTAAVGLIGTLAEKSVEAAEREKKLDSATDGLRGALSNMGSAATSTRDGILSIGDASEQATDDIGDLNQRIETMIEDNAQLAETIGDLFTEAGQQVGTLEGYYSVIEELGGRSDLTAEEVANLELAVQGVNDKCGTSYEVAQDAGGAYQIMADGAAVAKDEVLKLVKAQEAQIQLDASKEAYEEAYKTLAEHAETAAAAQTEFNDAQDAFNKLMDETNGVVDANDALTQNTIKRYEEAQESLDDATEAYEAQKNAVDLLRDSQTLYQMALDAEEGSIIKAVANNLELVSAFNNAGKSSLDLVEDLDAVGASTESLGELSKDQMAKVADAYDGTYSSIADLLSEYGVNVDESKAKTQSGMEAVRQALADAGAGTEDLASISDESLQSLVEVYDGSVASIVDKMDELGVKVPESVRETAQSATKAINGENPLTTAAASDVAEGVSSKYEQLRTSVPLSASNAAKGATSAISGESGNTANAAQKLVSGADNQIRGTVSLWSGVGSSGASGFASGISSQQGATGNAANAVANASSSINKYSGSTYGWGQHAGSNFANGLSSAVSWVRNAAATLAEKVKSILGHTVPEDGPLRNGGKGEAEWGAHTVQNYIAGIESQIPSLEQTMGSVSSTVADALTGNGCDLDVSAGAVKAATASAIDVNVTSSISQGDIYAAMVKALGDSDANPQVRVFVGGREVAAVVDSESGYRAERSKSIWQ